MKCEIKENAYSGEYYIEVVAETTLERVAMNHILTCKRHTDKPDNECHCHKSVVFRWSEEKEGT